MPLKDKEIMKAERAGPWFRTGPSLIKPNDDALQSISKRETDSTESIEGAIEGAINRGTLVLPYRKATELLSAANLVNCPDGRDKGG